MEVRSHPFYHILLVGSKSLSLTRAAYRMWVWRQGSLGTTLLLEDIGCFSFHVQQSERRATVPWMSPLLFCTFLKGNIVF